MKPFEREVIKFFFCRIKKNRAEPNKIPLGFH